MGNIVNFGPRNEDNYIKSATDGHEIPLRRKGGVFVIDGICPKDNKPVEITVDSGAEESVCPLYWGREFGLDTRGPRIDFTAANGSRIKHYGSRQVDIVSPF